MKTRFKTFNSQCTGSCRGLAPYLGAVRGARISTPAGNSGGAGKPRPQTARTEPVSAFSLIEILVTVGLLSFIIFGLLAMFNQTQRAFRLSMTQTDVLESARATMDMVARDVEQAAPCEYPNIYANGAWYRATNFFVEPSPFFNNPPLYQGLPGTATVRTNQVQRFFFLSKLNQDVIGTGYLVVPDDANGMVGTLYRFSGTNQRSAPVTVSGAFLSAANIALGNMQQGLSVTNLSRIADGLVHLRVRAFSTNGSLIVAGTRTNGFALTPNPIGPYAVVGDTIVVANNAFDPLQTACYFMKEAVPAYIEVEMGMLEPQTTQRYRSIGVPAVQRTYLSNHVAQVHIFRQRIPIRNVDFTAYP